MEVDEFRQELERIAGEQAALDGNVVNPPVFLPGEDPGNAYLDDTRHWVTVYRELITLKEKVVDDLDQGRQEVSEPGQVEVNRDQELIGLELRRLRLHLDFWEARLR
ncbi:MAG TPA: hypothetical protein VIA06_05235 [Candidatus Dormibacteraeota bacterium]|jgi:hypothetical protein|nr:hypothetical protein [Candidatus Dormibacteraeota bacterium]